MDVLTDLKNRARGLALVLFEQASGWRARSGVQELQELERRDVRQQRVRLRRVAELIDGAEEDQMREKKRNHLVLPEELDEEAVCVLWLMQGPVGGRSRQSSQ